MPSQTIKVARIDKIMNDYTRGYIGVAQIGSWKKDEMGMLWGKNKCS